MKLITPSHVKTRGSSRSWSETPHVVSYFFLIRVGRSQSHCAADPRAILFCRRHIGRNYLRRRRIIALMPMAANARELGSGIKK
jgi:hypothetical protein